MRRLNSTEPTFGRAFDALIAESRDAQSDVDDVVAEILGDVRRNGDAAVLSYTAKFDRLDLTTKTLRLSDDDVASAEARCAPETLAALNTAAERIRAYHEKQMPGDERYTDTTGVTLGWRWSAVDAAGLYVPGGTAAYPSSVLMNAIPARVAGVTRLVVTVPTPDGEVNDLVLAACRIAGVDEIYRIGGAQAVGALAYGTETIAPVDKIVGPGNAYVASAKRQVFGLVGIDMVAGPSEVTVVADAQNDPAWIAADLLAQAEHDANAQSVLITDDADFADAVVGAVASHLKTLPRADIARESWDANGVVITVSDMADVPALVDRIAPEHLELAVEDPNGLAAEITHAGAIFLGRHTPEALGDYVAGPSHVLPTSGTARFSSGLGVLDFMKRTSLISASPEGLRELGQATVDLADAEGLGAHARSVALRLNLPER